jgi:hypothetical protein
MASMKMGNGDENMVEAIANLQAAEFEAEPPATRRERLESFLWTYMPEEAVPDLITTLLAIPRQDMLRLTNDAIADRNSMNNPVGHLLISDVVYTILFANESINRLDLIDAYLELHIGENMYQ